MSLFWTVADFSLSTLLGFVCILLLSDGWRFPMKKVRALVAVYLVLLVALDSMGYVLLGNFTDPAVGGYGLADTVVFLINVLSGPVMLLVLTRWQGGRTLFAMTTGYLFVFLGNTPSLILWPTLGLGQLLGKVIIYGLMLVWTLRVFRSRCLAVVGAAASDNRFLFLIPTTLLLAFALLEMYPNDIRSSPTLWPVAAALMAVTLCTYGAFYSFFHAVEQHHRFSEDNAVLRTQMGHVEQLAHERAEAERDGRIFRHDMRHVLQILSSSLEQHNYDGALAVLRRMDDDLLREVSAAGTASYTGSALLDSVLGVYQRQAQEQGVTLTIRMGAPQEHVDLPGLCVVLSNALENAMNACIALPEGAAREIRATADAGTFGYSLSIENTFDGSITLDLETGYPVSARPGHGYGTKSIAAFAQNHNAVLDYKIDGGWFRLRLHL